MKRKDIVMVTMESLPLIFLSAHSFHKLPLLLNQKSKPREYDPLGWKLEHLYHNPDRGVFFRWRGCTLFLNLSKVNSMNFLEKLAGAIWLRDSIWLRGSNFSPQFCWEIIDLYHCKSLRHTAWWFNIYILRMITAVSSANIHPVI